MSGRLLERTYWPWAGLIGGPVWYAAHDLAFYLSGVNCERGWIAPLIQVVALTGALGCSYLSYSSIDGSAGHRRSFAGTVGTGAGLLFSVAILYQALAAFVYDGCAR